MHCKIDKDACEVSCDVTVTKQTSIPGSLSFALFVLQQHVWKPLKHKTEKILLNRGSD